MTDKFRFNGGMNSHSLEFGPQALLPVLRPHQPVKRWLVGFSGGLDSTALLAALVAAEPEQPVLAIHVNHGLSPQADNWQRHCEDLCRQWRVECRVEKVAVRSAGHGLEDAARAARYRAFQAHMEEGDVLLLGHHRDDQAETLLFRLMRGAGPRGLGAIVAQRPFGKGRLVRPLLDFSREALEAYARDAGLVWITDESNRDESFDRNFLRHQVMPLLEKRWPDFGARWARSAEACQEAEQLNRDLAALDLEHCGERPERLGWSVDRNSLVNLPDYRRNNLLRHWATALDLPVMERKHLEEIEKQLFAPAPSPGATVEWSGASLRTYRERLFLLPPLPPRPDRDRAPLAWTGQEELTLPDGSRLSAEPAEAGLKVPLGRAEVQWRKGGERCKPAGRARSQTLKKLLQEFGLEPWLRDGVPLIYLDGQLAAVGDLWVCSEFMAETQPACQLRWQVGASSA